MRRQTAAFLLVISALAMSAVAAQALDRGATRRTQLCQNLKLIAVRGSGDGSSPMGVIGTAVSAALDNLAADRNLYYVHHGVPYTAVGIAWYKLLNVQLPEYRLSVRDGRNKLYAYIHQEVADCPGEQLAVIGYSQGAQVVGDVLSKGLGRLTARELANVRGVALVADPRFNSQEPYDRGSFRKGRNGLLGARGPGDLSAVARKIASWCRKDDLICQGPGTTGNHAQSNYLGEYQDEIVQFLAEKLGFPKHPHGGEGVVSTNRIGDLRFGISSGVDVNKFAGDPDRVFGPADNLTWAGFDNWSEVRFTRPGVITVDGYRCHHKVGRAPCTAFYAYDNRYRLVGFETNSPLFHTLRGSSVGTKIATVLKLETGHGPYAGTQVQCPSLSLAAPTGTTFRLFLDSNDLPPTVDSLFVSRSAGFLDSCD